MAVKATEQLFPGTGIGVKKKKWGLGLITSKCKISADEVEMLLESFLNELNKDKLQPILYEGVTIGPDDADKVKEAIDESISQDRVYPGAY